MNRAEILLRLQREILPLQGYQAAAASVVSIGCPAIEAAFPNGMFPTGAVHEFVSSSMETAAASSGFISAVSSFLLRNGGAAIWISAARTLFPAGLVPYDIDPSNIIFVDVKKEQHVLWAMEEALKCSGLTAVIGEVKDLNFTNSRRFQLAVEQSRATGFIIHHQKKQSGVNACVARWKIASQPGALPDDLPGVGFPRWKVELLKVRNGKPGEWIMEWKQGKFNEIIEPKIIHGIPERKAG